MSLAADAPNVVDWIAAIGQAAGSLFTAAAVVVAVWLGWRDRRWRREEQAAQTAERADREAAQARLITVEPQVVWHSYDEWRLVGKVSNGSAFPVMDVQIVEMRNADQPTLRWRYDVGDDPDPDTRYDAAVLSAGEPFRISLAFASPSGGPVDPPPG